MRVTYALRAERHTLEIERTGDDVQIELDGEQGAIRLLEYAPPRITFLHQGRVVTAHVAADGSKRWVHFGGATFEFERVDEVRRRTIARGQREGASSGIITAPMPGQVRGVLVQAGDAVTEGQPIVVLEAMKMELKVNAPHDGVVSRIEVTEGQSVDREHVLGEIKMRSER